MLRADMAWTTIDSAALSLNLAPDVRAQLGSWVRAYGDLNRIVGLDRGPLAARFARVRRHASAD